MTKTIVGLFHEAERVKRAIDMLECDGYDAGVLSIITQDIDSSGSKSVYMNTAERIVSGTAYGSVVGGIGGVFFYGLSGSITIALFAIFLGGVTGAFIASRLTRQDSSYYESLINEGAMLLAVPHRLGEQTKVTAILRAVGAFDVKIFPATIDMLMKKYDIESALDLGAFSLQYMYSPIGVKGGKAGKKETTAEKL